MEVVGFILVVLGFNSEPNKRLRLTSTLLREEQACYSGRRSGRGKTREAARTRGTLNREDGAGDFLRKRRLTSPV